MADEMPDDLKERFVAVDHGPGGRNLWRILDGEDDRLAMTAVVAGHLVRMTAEGLGAAVRREDYLQIQLDVVLYVIERLRPYGCNDDYGFISFESAVQGFDPKI